MKVVLLLIAFTACAISSTSQVVIALLFGDKLNTEKLEFGLSVSPGLTNISNENSKFKGGLNLGLYLNFRPDRRFYLRVEAIGKGSMGGGSIAPYSTGNAGLDSLLKAGSVQRKISSFGLPLLCRYRIAGRFFAEAGVQVDWFLHVKDIFEADVAGGQLSYTKTTSDQYTKFDLAFAGGLFYKLRADRKSVGLGLRYVQGVTDIGKAAAGTQTNVMWQLHVTIPVGAGKTPASSPAP